jgi:hypothetical protein
MGVPPMYMNLKNKGPTSFDAIPHLFRSATRAENPATCGRPLNIQLQNERIAIFLS